MSPVPADTSPPRGGPQSVGHRRPPVVEASVLARLAHGIIRLRWLVIALWILLTVLGAYAAGQLSSRWLQSTSVPGRAAYETGQQTLKVFGTGVRPPNVVVFHSSGGDVTEVAAVRAAMTRVAQANPTALTSSFFSTGSSVYVSTDRHTTFQEVYLPGRTGVDRRSGAAQMRTVAALGLPAGVTVEVTGRDPLDEANTHSGGSSVLVEALIGGFGALVVLLFVFGTMTAILMPLLVAVAAILNTFTLVWALTYFADVSVIVKFLIALVGLGVAIDYALLMIFRFRDELRDGKDVESALAQTMTHAGRSVILSGTTVAFGLLALLVVPLPLLRSMSLGGALIPIVSVLAATTLLPAMLAVAGTRINSGRVMPRRLLDSGHPENGSWGRWARFVIRRPVAIGLIGLVIVLVFAGLGTRLNVDGTELRYFPGTGTAIAGRDQLAAAGISPGVMKPLNVLVTPGGDAQAIATRLRAVPGIDGAAAPPQWRRGSTSLVEAFPSIDGAAPGIQTIVDRVNTSLEGTDGKLTGVTATDRDFLHALFSGFAYAIALVMILTLVLLTRAFRSVVLAVKAVLLNLFSLAAAYGIVVFVFQQGHGSSLWGVTASHSITAYIPVVIFAFLFGLSMDYEVFMLARIREAYDQTRSTNQAIALGLARTGKLVTSAALILMFAFLVLSSSPGFEVKSLAIGLAAGIIFDATVIRALLVPATMRLLGDANWWLPDWIATVLRIPIDQRVPATARHQQTATQ